MSKKKDKRKVSGRRIKGFGVKSNSGLCKLIVKDHYESDMETIGNELVQLGKYILMSIGDKDPLVKVFEVEVGPDGEVKNVEKRGTAKSDTEKLFRDIEDDGKDCDCLKCAMEALVKQALVTDLTQK